MKTQILKAISPGSTAYFLDDLRFMLADEHQLLIQAVSGWLTAFVAAGSDSEREKLVETISKSTKSNQENAKKAFGMLAFMAPAMSQAEVPEVFVNDFCEDIGSLLSNQHLSPLTESESTRLRELMSGLASRGAEIKRSLSVSLIKRGVMPMYERIEATIEMRALESPFISDVEPKDIPLELLPLATMRVILDSGDPSEICLQATEEDIAELIKKLQQLQNSMSRIKERVSVRKE